MSKIMVADLRLFFFFFFFCKTKSRFDNFKYAHYEYVRMDATVAERLSSSPNIFDIYGHCGLGIMSEYFPHGDMASVAMPHEHYLIETVGEDVTILNNLTSAEKLSISLQMAEGLADLHGNPYGVVVHQDLNLEQYLYTADKSRVKLNDFNRAEFMLWDDRRQSYCRYCEGGGFGAVSVVLFSVDAYEDAEENE